jgi:hypothetical protein
MSQTSDEGRVFPPTRCRMPDLSDVPTARSLAAMLNLMFRRKGFSGHPGQGLFSNLLRLTDSAVLEYEAARASLDEFVSTPTNVMSPFFRTIDHLETCISALDRASRCAESISAEAAVSSIPSRQVRRRISRARNAIEHADRDLVKGRIGLGSYTTLAPMNERVEIGPIVVTYEELALWIRALSECAAELMEHDVDAADPAD